MRVVIIAIDAMDRELLAKFGQRLPNLTRIVQEGAQVRSQSVFPPDTPSAWATIHTGLNPARHGIVLFIDPLDKATTLAFQGVSNEPIKGRSFWDIASRAGKRVCILFPELGYPVWPVNGIMVGRHARMYDSALPVVAYPAALSSQHNLAPLSRVVSLPAKASLDAHIEAHRRVALAELDLGLRLLKQEPWDLFLLFSTALDWAGHNLWSFFDPADPAYPGPNPYENSLLEFYQFYDDVVGQFVKELDSDTALLVLSDHGQGRRPHRLVNINELLRRRGLLVPRIKGKRVTEPLYLLEVLKRMVAQYVNRHGLSHTLVRLIRAFPATKRLYTSPLSIDWGQTAAYVSDLSGIKSYSYGGVIVEQRNLNGRDYEEVRSQIIAELKNLADPTTGQRLILWARRREEVYDGEFIGKYPDILFLLQDDYGVGWGIFEELHGDSSTHNMQPGSHKIDSPIFLAWGLERQVVRPEMTLMDVAPTILDLLGVTGDYGLDGTSILAQE